MVAVLPVVVFTSQQRQDIRQRASELSPTPAISILPVSPILKEKAVDCTVSLGKTAYASKEEVEVKVSFGRIPDAYEKAYLLWGDSKSILSADKATSLFRRVFSTPGSYEVRALFTDKDNKSLCNNPKEQRTTKIVVTDSSQVIGTKISLAVALQGVGLQGNVSPLTDSRLILVCIYEGDKDIGGDFDCTRSKVSKKGIVNYDVPSQAFTSSQFDLGIELPIGEYGVVISTNRYLRKNFGKLVVVSPTLIYALPKQQLLVGDVNSDNSIDVKDEDIIKECFTNVPTTRCQGFSQISDLDDNGIVDEVDYNLLIRNFNKKGD